MAPRTKSAASRKAKEVVRKGGLKIKDLAPAKGTVKGGSMPVDHTIDVPYK